MTAEQARLDYETPTPRSWWQRFGRALILLALSALAIIVLQYYRPVAAKIEYLLQQRRCMNYTAPSDQVVFTTRQDEVAALIARQGGYRAPRRLGPTTRAAGFTPPQLSAWQRSSALNTQNVAFMHERTSPDGNRRLVIIGVDTYPVRAGGAVSVRQQIIFWPFVLPPTGLFDSPDRRLFSKGTSMFLATGSFRVFAGQIDPNDSSAFTISFELDGQKGTIVGSLDDYERVKFTVKSGPAMLRRVE